MAYWVKRIALKRGEIVTEDELRHDENLFEGSAHVVGKSSPLAVVVAILRQESFGVIGLGERRIMKR